MAGIVLFIAINQHQQAYIYQHLSKLSLKTSLHRNTISRYFSKNKGPYIGKEWIIYKSSEVDLKSFNKGNLGNFKGKKRDIF